MLTEERHATILRMLEAKGAVTVLEICEQLGSSESTIRRDLVALGRMGRLNKVHGGATAINGIYNSKEDETSVKQDLNVEEKQEIAQYAAGLIKSRDFVFMDAGTTTERMIDYITETDAVYVTNGIVHARKLAQRGCNVFITAGHVKAVTEAIIGTETICDLQRYNFTMGFFGTNGVSLQAGFTTPDIDEARVKNEAIKRCNKSYILADPSKFNKIFPVNFAEISCASVITTLLQDEKFRSHTEILEVKGKDVQT